jgi:hypothetical protein
MVMMMVMTATVRLASANAKGRNILMMVVSLRLLRPAPDGRQPAVVPFVVLLL